MLLFSNRDLIYTIKNLFSFVLSQGVFLGSQEIKIIVTFFLDSIFYYKNEKNEYEQLKDSIFSQPFYGEVRAIYSPPTIRNLGGTNGTLFPSTG